MFKRLETWILKWLARDRTPVKKSDSFYYDWNLFHHGGGWSKPAPLFYCMKNVDESKKEEDE